MHWRIPLFSSIWKEYAKEYLGITNYIDNKILFNFDFWFTSEEYRKKISEKLGLCYKRFDQWLNDQECYKSGKKEILIGQGYAQKGKVMSSWKRFIEKDYRHRNFFLNILKDEEIMEYTRKIFNVELKKVLFSNE